MYYQGQAQGKQERPGHMEGQRTKTMYLHSTHVVGMYKCNNMLGNILVQEGTVRSKR